MAEINTGDSGGGKGKFKKQTLRVDFTPMVDMNLLLITFFMFCTTLSKPQMMDLAMPSNEKIMHEDEVPQAADTRTTTIILGENNVVYYYFGKPDFEDWTALKKTSFSPDGLRAMLTERNATAVAQVAEWRLQKSRKEISDEEFNERVRELKKDKKGQVVLIKPTDESTYENLVDALDEMQITSIGIYTLADMTEADEFMVKNYLTQGNAAVE